MRDDLARERAIESLRYGGQQGILAGSLNPAANLARAARTYEPTELEIAQAEEIQRKQMVYYVRREALSHTLTLGRRYDSADEAIGDAKVIAAWLGLEIE